MASKGLGRGLNAFFDDIEEVKSVSEEKQRGWPAGKHISISNHTADQQILELLDICVYMYTCNG